MSYRVNPAKPRGRILFDVFMNSLMGFNNSVRDVLAFIMDSQKFDLGE